MINFHGEQLSDDEALALATAVQRINLPLDGLSDAIRLAVVRAQRLEHGRELPLHDSTRDERPLEF